MHLVEDGVGIEEDDVFVVLECVCQTCDFNPCWVPVGCARGSVELVVIAMRLCYLKLVMEMWELSAPLLTIHVVVHDSSRVSIEVRPVEVCSVENLIFLVEGSGVNIKDTYTFA